MKRVLIIAGVFVAVVAALVGINFLSDGQIGPAGPTYGETTFDSLGVAYYNVWGREKEWNKPLFDFEMKELSTKKNFGNITEAQKNQLVQNVCTYALDKTDSLLRAEWKSPSCRRNVISKNYGCIAVVEKMGCLSKDRRVRELKDMYGTYNRICSLIDNVLKHPTFGVSAELDAKGGWKDLSNTITYVDAQIGGYKASSYYSGYFSKITEIKNSFDDAGTRSKNAADTYYSLVTANLEKRFDEEFKAVESSNDVRELQAYSDKLGNVLSELKKDCEKCGSKKYNDFSNFVSLKRVKITELKDKLSENEK